MGWSGPYITYITSPPSFIQIGPTLPKLLFEVVWGWVRWAKLRAEFNNDWLLPSSGE